jgi:phosphatidate cytidylyltransferase
MIGAAFAAAWAGKAAVGVLAIVVACIGYYELLTMFKIRKRSAPRKTAIALGGLAYMIIPLACAVGLYDAAPLLLFYAFVVTISTDTGAYAIGCALGGPKLAPSISPNKTWTGALGGLACALAFGGAFGIALLWQFGSSPFWALVSAGLSAVSQLGDLFESKLKRMAGVKDSSAIIPGHGGVLDRFDGMFFVAPGLFILLFSLGRLP